MSFLAFLAMMGCAGYTASNMVASYKNSLDERKEQNKENDPITHEICNIYKETWEKRYGDGNGGYSTLVGVGVAAQAVKLAVKLSKMSDEEKKDYLEYIRFRGIEIL